MSAPMDPFAPQPDPGGQLLIYRDGGLNLQVRLDGQTVWLTQRQMAELFQVTVPTVNEHLTNIYAEGELQPEATVRQFRIVQMEGSRRVSRNVDHYNLDGVLAVGYRVRSPQGTQFRQWATVQLRDRLVKGFVLDDERIKAGRTLGEDYDHPDFFQSGAEQIALGLPRPDSGRGDPRAGGRRQNAHGADHLEKRPQRTNPQAGR